CPWCPLLRASPKRRSDQAQRGRLACPCRDGARPVAASAIGRSSNTFDATGSARRPTGAAPDTSYDFSPMAANPKGVVIVRPMGAVPNSGPVVLALMLLVACVAVSFDGSATAAAPEQISVLILLPGQSELPAASAIATGIRASLVSARSFPISIATEHVDTDLLRAPGDGERHQQEMYRLYRSKFAGRPFDLIFVALNEPLGFVLRARDDIWPGTPVIACAVDERTLGGFTPPAGMVIATIRYDMEGTIRAALGLLPDTRHVALVGGIAPLDRTFHDLGRQAVQDFGGRLDLIDT